MNRRTFLFAAGSAVAAPSRIIDTHTHFYDPDRPQGVPWPSKNDKLLYRRVLPNHYKEIARPLGVTGTIVVEASPWVEDNQWILDLAKDDPFIVGLVGHLEPGQPEFKANLERFRKSRQFLGIRAGAGSLSKGGEDFKRLAEAGLELDVLGPASMLPNLVRFADRFRDLRIVINHLPLEGSAGSPALRELGQRPNVFAKISGAMRREDGHAPLDELWALFGPDRVVYGSNWPVCEKAAPYATVQSIVMDYFTARGADAAENYFWRNSQAAYRWVQR